MPWFKIDDEWHDHPKVRKAGNAAAGLWARCGSHCAQYLTDGFVDVEIAKRYGTTKEVRSLLDAKLWSVVDGGYLMPDYLDYNPSAEQVKKDRAAAAERQRKKRGHGGSHGVTNGVTSPASHAPPDPTRPDPSQQVSDNSTPENTGKGVDNSRRSDVLTAYEELAIEIAEGKGINITSYTGYRKKARVTGESHPDLNRWLATYPTAPTSAVAAWMTGDTHSMSYYPRSDELATVHHLPGATA